MLDRLLVASAAICAGIVLWSGPREWSIGKWAFGLLILAWVLLPFHLLRPVTKLAEGSDASVKDRTLRAVAWLFALGTPVVYGQILVGRQSSTAALVFVFLPLYQLLLIGGVSLFGGWIDRRTKGR